MSSIAFFDTEVDKKTGKVWDIGATKTNGTVFHESSAEQFQEFIRGEQFICGHNVVQHDLKYLSKPLGKEWAQGKQVIDTLFLSPLMFPTKPYHHLLKDEKLQTEELNNPLNDAVKAKELFFDEVNAFLNYDMTLRRIFYFLLKDQKGFGAFFRYLDFQPEETDLLPLIKTTFKGYVCEQALLESHVFEHPIELAYCLSLIHDLEKNAGIQSLTPRWVLRNFPLVENMMTLLRNKPCLTGCAYCDKALDGELGLREFFGFEQFRTFGGEPLQKKAVEAALKGESLIAIFPTGGGKSITFQIPALMSGKNDRGLTVVISPLQSLMKDQVDNLEKNGITEAVTINGLLNPIERSNAFNRVEDGSASLLYIAPESLRSKSIENLFLSRKISRFVIDEAHCFSIWGQDFRVDYLYIADFINALQKKKNLTESIPISCFTATAKPQVIADIKKYFKEGLGLELQLFNSNVARSNLHYKVFSSRDEEDKYQTLRRLIEEKDCPSIVYVSRTKKADELAWRLYKDGFSARSFHGRMKTEEKIKNQNEFIEGGVQIMVATSAFGMGVDKKDVGLVIHYDISDSLENYIQEAGRAGRDQSLQADCFILYNEEDLSKHFILLNQTKITLAEIQQVWRAIKRITDFRDKISSSALEIARKAGWDDSVSDIESRVKTAIAALEDAGYLKRGQNNPRIFATGILLKNAQEAIHKIEQSGRFSDTEKVSATRIIKRLFSAKNSKESTEVEAETRVDYISDRLGIPKREVLKIIGLLREEKILADSKDLKAFIKKKDNLNRSKRILEDYGSLGLFFLENFDEEEKVFHLKQLNESAEKFGCKRVSLLKLTTLLNFWKIQKWIKAKKSSRSTNHMHVLSLLPKHEMRDRFEKRQKIAGFIIDYLFSKIEEGDRNKEEVLIDFSMMELKEEFKKETALFPIEISPKEIEDALFYLSRIGALHIEGDFLVIYNGLSIERLEKGNRVQYKIEDYQKLKQFYNGRVQQIHIVGEYARKMIQSYQEALQFVDDYFRLSYPSFLHKYFPGSDAQRELNLKMTRRKFEQLFGRLSPLQLKIVNDSRTQYIVVAAGPGSGKTRVLVHKLASLLLMEDVKHEQLLMVTFSRAAASEFKERLLKLIGNAAYFVEIKTFHSYCFDLLGKIGSLEKSDEIIREAVQKIKENEVEASRITKSVLVIDEAQDMDAQEFELIKTLMRKNPEMRVLAVGDDDQNIYEFRGSSPAYLEKFFRIKTVGKYELTENFRSKNNLVQFSEQFVRRLSQRLKSQPLVAHQKENGALKIIRHTSPHLILPLVENLLQQDLTGTTAILTQTNEEALQVMSQLLKHNIPAELVQTNVGFSLFNLSEIRFFLRQVRRISNSPVIDAELWEDAKRALKDHFSGSDKLEIVGRIIQTFEKLHAKTKYRNDFEIFIRESKLEDFYAPDGKNIFVSTIHKSKGKEFDSVFLLLNRYRVESDEEKRKLYVGMTRAKSNLYIHLNSGFLDHVKVADMEWQEDQNQYAAPGEMVMQLSHQDVWLDYFEGRQDFISKLRSGDKLQVFEEGCLDKDRNPVLRFSRQFKEKIERMRQRAYFLKSAQVNFMVYWKKEEEKELQIVLPEVHFERREEADGS